MLPRSQPDNLLQDLPERLPEELVSIIASGPHVRIERIVSTGHCSPPDDWYDQNEHEWVMLLQGKARLTFEDASSWLLQPGDHLLIPAHCRHKVEWTTPSEPTVWLAVFYSV